VNQTDQHISRKIPPHDLDIERAVLGAMMLEKEAVSSVLEIIPAPEILYSSRHQKIFQAILNLDSRGDEADLITVSEELKRMNQLESIGSSLSLTECTESVISTVNVQQHAKILLEKSLLRKTIQVCDKIINECYDPRDETFNIIDKAEQEVLSLSDIRSRTGFEKIKNVLFSSYEVVEKLHERKGGITGVRTGFRDLDEMTSGFQASELIIIAGRPSSGKTAFALNIARNAAVEDKVPVGIFSLEMSSLQLGLRLICSEAEIDWHRIRTGKIPDSDWPKLSMSIGKLGDSQIFIDDSAGLSIIELRAKARRLKSEHGVGMIVVDYIGLIKGPPMVESRQQEIAFISRNLKGLAKELNIPIVALSQLSRAIETRGMGRPMLSDLRESGALEQDADVVLFINPKTKDDEIGIGEPPSETEIIIGKQRNGPTGSIDMIFRRSITKFESKSFVDYGEEPF